MSSALEDDLPSDDRQGISDTRTYDTSGERKLIAMDERRVAPFKRYSGDTNIWALDEHARIKLVYAFQSLYAEKARKEFLNVSRETLEKHQQYAALRNKHDIDVMKNCEILGMTVTGAAMRANLLEEVKPSVMIVEEAAEILEGQLVAAIPPSVQHLILIGDHKQLKPVVKNSRLRRSCHLDVSMFERLVNCDIPLMQLEYQCRMREDIVDLLRSLNIYKELKTKTELICKYNPPHCVEKSMYFCFHKSDEKPSKDSHSKRNPTEARMITEAAKKFCKGGVVRPSEITVLCAYRGQIREINDSFKSSNVAEMAEIKVTTIDAFQGQENNIILVSLVRSNAENKIGYLTQKNRVCVAISRARCGLYLFGNQAQLASASGVWRAIVEYMREKDCLVKEIPFRSIDETASSSRSEGESESGSSLKGRAKSGAQNTTFNIQAQNVNIFNFIGDQTVVQIPDNSTSAEMIAQRTQTPGSGGTPSEEPQSYLINISKVKTKEQSEEGSKFPTQEEGFEEVNKEKPIQETQVARKAQEVEDEEKRQGDQVKRVQQELGNREPLQAENGRSTVETESYREEASPMQETMATDKSTSAEMTTCQLQTPGSGEPLQTEKGRSTGKTGSYKEEASPIQETMAAGKGPFEETGLEVGVKIQPTDEKE